eukprot:TRINITY_DN1391_c0_g1_i2.p1 TRINITY_DN1391_c0_g1~~TRINITY_DN1391_c0_g1_i2.p1  ORF type:complete len:658 (+),score=78.96 TRINITY_DN1391_c0_g1_i2:71-2044(+)
MQLPLVITFTGPEYPDVIFEATKDSVVGDAVRAAAQEWDIKNYLVDLSFEGNMLSWQKNLFSLGVEAHSQLVASSAGCLFGKDDLADETTLQMATKLYEAHNILHLKLSTFVHDGALPDISLPSAFRNLSFHDTDLTTQIFKSSFSLINVETITFEGLRVLHSIGNKFFSRCIQLTKLDITSAVKISFIGKDFLTECIALTTLLLPSTSNIKLVVDGFLSGCTSLTAVDLSFLSNAKTIGCSFLCGCEALTTLALPPFEFVTRIGNDFLCGCAKLTELDITSATSISVIGNRFLQSCVALKVVNLPTFTNIMDVRQDFLSDCSSLTKVDLTSLRQKGDFSSFIPFRGPCSVSINGLLERCTSLSTLSVSCDSGTLISANHLAAIFAQSLITTVNLTITSKECVITDNFLAVDRGEDDIAVSTLTLSCDARLFIGNGFLRNFASLESANLLLSNTFIVRNSFMMGCVGLSTLTLSLDSVKAIGSDFLRNCRSLTTVELSSLRNVTSIGNSFLMGCNNLSTITLSCDLATSIGFDFLRGCTSLTTADLSLSNVTEIGSTFLSGCSSLSRLSLSCDDGMTFVGRPSDTVQPSLMESLKELPLTSLLLSGNLQRQIHGSIITELSEVRGKMKKARGLVLSALEDLQDLHFKMQALYDTLLK